MATAWVQSLFRTPLADSSLHGSSTFNERGFHPYNSITTPEHRGPSPLPLPSLYGKDISRSSSAVDSLLSQQSQFHNRPAILDIGRTEEYSRQALARPALPGLSELASLATVTPTRSFSGSSASLSATQIMQPIPTPGISGINAAPPVCQNCQTSTTPLWRRDESGSVLCNACGLFLKLHGRSRPISLKTDVIKSRNRVKSAAQGPRKKYESLPASQSVETPNGAHRRVSQMAPSIPSDRSGSPISRTISPNGHHDLNIAPQHLFDGVSLADHAFNSPSLPSLHVNQPSPGSASSDRHLEPPMTYEQLLAANTILKTRVSELEVINMMYSDNENTLRKARDNAVRVQDDLRKRVYELEERLQKIEDQEQPQKRPRLSDTAL